MLGSINNSLAISSVSWLKVTVLIIRVSDVTFDPHHIPGQSLCLNLNKGQWGPSGQSRMLPLLGLVSGSADVYIFVKVECFLITRETYQVFRANPVPSN
jgi:hypothetical protein